MDVKWDSTVPIPDDLDQVIQQGIARGRQEAARRRTVRRRAVRSAGCLVLVMCLFVGGLQFSPAFAAAMEDVPVLGQLVRVFGKNQAVVEGGSQNAGDSARLSMERSGDTEQMRLVFPLADASRYRAEFASYPKTVTITLPGTHTVEILSQISRAKDTSQYIKSVCQLPTSTAETAVLQLTLESDAEVQIQEYRDPGSLVIRLTPADIQLDTIYSVRTLSLDAEGLAAASSRFDSHAPRVLQDDSGTFFLELGQFSSREEAEGYAKRTADQSVIVEARVGNNVPVAFASLQAYENTRLLDAYYELLITSHTAQPVLDFLDTHLAQASPQAQDEMLRGLAGFLADGQEAVDWSKVAGYYQQAGQTPPESIAQYINP